jgi:sRNA-binding protein
MGGNTEVQIKQCLVRYTQSARYVMSVVEGTHSFNLNGESVDLIGDEHRERAKEKIMKLRKSK